MATKKMHHFKKEVKDLKLKGWLGYRLEKSELSFSKLSLMLGMNKSYLSTVAIKGDFTGTQLVALGNYLDTDPFEPYRPLLHATARTTAAERLQAQRIAELELQITTLTQERDWLKEVVMKK